MTARIEQIRFRGSTGAELAARIDLPAAPPTAYALFAHCFTCGKDGIAAARVAAELTEAGIAVFRFDFAGLGESSGDFADTSFSSSVEDLMLAAAWMRSNRHAPQILIGHSFGGAAVLAVASDVPEVRAVATIAAPSTLDAVVQIFGADLAGIAEDGEAEVELDGRRFTIRRQFIEDLRAHSITERVATIGRPLLILHSPVDEIVAVEHASRLFSAARHPKSYVSLDHANHLLTDRADATDAARVIVAWAKRYLVDEGGAAPTPDLRAQVVVAETMQGTFLNEVVAGRHHFLVDEPAALGGNDAGPTPEDLLGAALGACTSMTLRMYARRKQLPLERVLVEVDQAWMDAGDRHDGAPAPSAYAFERRITLEGPLEPAARARLLEIANRCPVHRILEGSSTITTTLV